MFKPEPNGALGHRSSLMDGKPAPLTKTGRVRHPPLQPRDPTLRSDRQGLLSWASSWGHRNAAGICRSDMAETAGKAAPRIPEFGRAWCDAHDRCRTVGSLDLRCRGTVRGGVASAKDDSAGRTLGAIAGP